MKLLKPIMSVSIYIAGLIDPAISGDLTPFTVGIMDTLKPSLSVEPDLSGLQIGLLFTRITYIIFFILGGVLLIISSIRQIIGRLELKKAKRKWLRNGIIYIAGNIIVYLNLLLTVPNQLEEMGFTIELNAIMGVGMILTFVAGGILILGYLVAKVKPAEVETKIEV